MALAQDARPQMEQAARSAPGGSGERTNPHAEGRRASLRDKRAVTGGQRRETSAQGHGTLQPAPKVFFPGASLAERNAPRGARHLPPLVQLLSNWRRPHGLKKTARKVRQSAGKVKRETARPLLWGRSGRVR